ncbi:MAG: hypothetical protein LBN24_09935 [Mediterranea sp.]|jgi:hypothetical protein|nr:hypothetical protein [Mediterranea sp.]
MKKLPILLATASLLALSAACTNREETTGHARAHTGECDVSLQLNVPFQPITRAATPEQQEAAIHSVHLLVFDGKGTTDTADAKFAYWRKAWLRSGTTYQSTLIQGERLNIYIAANADEDLFNNLAVGTTWSQAKEQLLLTNHPRDFRASLETKGLPLWGQLLNQTISAGSTRILYTDVKLIRAVAAVNISVTATNFQLEAGYISSASNAGYLAYEPAYTGTKGNNIYITQPNVPANTQYTKDYYSLSQSEKAILNKFYIYENKVGPNETKVILQGRYSLSGKTTFYPLALRDPALPLTQKQPVVRNTKFFIQVTNVNGNGYDTYEEAERAEEVNLTYEVVPWNETTDNVFIDGSQYFFIDSRRDKVTLPRYIGASHKLYFSTSYALTDIKMKLKGGTTAANETLDEHARFKLERKQEIDNEGKLHHYFEVSTKLAYEAAANDLSTTFEVSVGRLLFTITATQIEGADDDWDEGYEIGREL